MMTPFVHPECNMVLNAPVDWDEAGNGECMPLPVHRISANDDGQLPAFRSYWKPSAAQLQRLVVGEAVMLEIVGTSHPPVAVDVTGVSEGPVSLSTICNTLIGLGVKVAL